VEAATSMNSPDRQSGSSESNRVPQSVEYSVKFIQNRPFLPPSFFMLDPASENDYFDSDIMKLTNAIRQTLGAHLPPEQVRQSE